MGKGNPKPGQAGVSLPALSQKELCQRVQFAVQASTYLQSLGLAAGPSDRKGKRKAVHAQEGPEELADHNGGAGLKVDFEALARNNMKATKKMAAHTQLKLDPSLKRAMCRGCGTYLIPGLTSRIRNRPHKRTVNTTHTSCLHCSKTLSIPSPPLDSDLLELDGPIRRKRREAAAKRSKIAFHEVERGDTNVGHALWVNEKKLDGWGERQAEDKAQTQLDETST